MNPMELTSRVTWESAAAVVFLAFGAGLIGEASAAAGIGVGGALAITNFRWLAGRVVAVLQGAPAPGRWSLGLGFRLIALTSVTAGLVMSGWAHPVGIVVGLTVLPCDLVVRGLAQAAAEG
jgi:ATP synthase I chain